MRYTLLIFTCGREEYLKQAILSARDNLIIHEFGQHREFDHVFFVDDSCDLEFHKKLYQYNIPILSRKNKMGFAGAIKFAWETIPETDYIFHLEEDFIFEEKIYLNVMAKILNSEPTTSQVALKRQAWNDEEKKAGGIIEQWPELYRERFIGGQRVTEHSNFFTTNPSLYRYSLTKRGWPDVPNSEKVFSDKIFSEGMKSVFLGSKFESPKVRHIGINRSINSSGY